MSVYNRRCRLFRVGLFDRKKKKKKKNNNFTNLFIFFISISFFSEDKTLHFGMDDEFLIIFLRPCKFYAKSAYELMRRVAEFKEKNSSILKNLMPNDEEELITKHNVVNVIKERDHKGRRILVVQCGKNWNTSAVNSDQIFRLFYLIHELAMLEPETQVRFNKKILDRNRLCVLHFKREYNL